MKRTLSIVSLGLALSLAGCAYSVHMVEMGDVDFVRTSQAQEITASGEQFAVLGFVTQTDYVDQAMDRLKGQCPNKKISGIQARYSTALGFLSWTNKVVLHGYCHM